jgi:protein-S-isoprenylcysteine O-methyltransferase Ste14
MYIGISALYAGIALLCRSVWPLLLLPLVVLIVQRTAIDREEAYMERRFGAEYRNYKARVRRWL